MKKLIPIVIAVLAMIAVPTKAVTCPTGVSLSGGGYVNANGTGNGFTCTIGNLTFSNFSFTSSAAGNSQALTPAGVTVTDLPNSSFPGVPDGFLFTEALGANSNGGIPSNSDMTIFYTVTSNAATITDLELGFNGAFTGTGFAEVTESFCLNSATVLGCSSANSGMIQVTNPPPVFNTQTTFAAVTTLSVEKDVQVNSGSGSGTANISSVNNNFSQTVPESASLTLLGLGLLGVALAKRSKLGQLSL
jgi:hypothetical protein